MILARRSFTESFTILHSRVKDSARICSRIIQRRGDPSQSFTNPSHPFCEGFRRRKPINSRDFSLSYSNSSQLHTHTRATRYLRVRASCEGFLRRISSVRSFAWPRPPRLHHLPRGPGCRRRHVSSGASVGYAPHRTTLAHVGQENTIATTMPGSRATQHVATRWATTRRVDASSIFGIAEDARVVRHTLAVGRRNDRSACWPPGRRARHPWPTWATAMPSPTAEFPQSPDVVRHVGRGATAPPRPLRHFRRCATSCATLARVATKQVVGVFVARATGRDTWPHGGPRAVCHYGRHMYMHVPLNRYFPAT